MINPKTVKSGKTWYLGLDLGVASVGWAATSPGPDYKILRAKGKDLWGIREFEEADPASERRSFRTSRRRIDREQARRKLLRTFFSDAIAEVDPGFFVRLDSSFLADEDKPSGLDDKFSLFADENFTDKDFHKKYPTIYHLRQAQINDAPDAFDPRLVFLAINHILKARGHFLDSGLTAKDGRPSLKSVFDEFSLELYDHIGVNLQFSEEALHLLADKKMKKTSKSDTLRNILGVDKGQKAESACINALCGRVVAVRDLYPDLDDKSVKFNVDSFDEESFDKITSLLGEDGAEFFQIMKDTHDAVLLDNLLDGCDYLSEAMVGRYEKHKEDLVKLKRVVRKFGKPADFDDLFRSDGPGGYSAYVNSNNTKGIKKRRSEASNAKVKAKPGRGFAAFYDKVAAILQGFPENKEVKEILEDIELGSFMPKQRSAVNGVIPNQLHEAELKKILANASKHLPFLLEKDEEGVSVSDKIIMLLVFHVPFYVGPIGKGSKYGWAVRKEAGRVFPWNIQEKIDVDATREEFIKRLIRDCSYISGGKVLPRYSLLYELFAALNEINAIRIAGVKITREEKALLIAEMKRTGKRLTKKRIASIISASLLREEEVMEEQISGVDSTLGSSLSSYARYKAALGESYDIDSREGRAAVERMILLGAVYGESKKEYKEQLKKNFPRLSGAQISRISGFNQQGWGRLSKEFLYLEGVKIGTAEMVTLINAMEEDSFTLQELLSAGNEKYAFTEGLEGASARDTAMLSDISEASLEGAYFSASVKKTIGQALKIVKELSDVMGCPPKKIFIETTRYDGTKGDNGRTSSREKMLLDLQKSIKDEVSGSEYCKFSGAITYGAEKDRLKHNKLFLYILQLGRDAYTGEEIDIDKLFEENLYDVDHIYPRCIVADNNVLNNLVLTNKHSNNAVKGDKYPLPGEIRDQEKVVALWTRLHSLGLMNDEKYKRLMSREKLSEKQRTDFIARQMVETAQSVKGLADILKRVKPFADAGTQVVYSKARNVSEFRACFDWMKKTRLVNEFHHAHDAYLNIVVGNMFHTKFTSNPAIFIKNEYLSGARYTLQIDKMIKHDIERNGACAWKASSAGNGGSAASIKKMLSKNTPLLTRQAKTAGGALAKTVLTGHEKAKTEGYLPLKTEDPALSNVERYGGYSSPATAYFFLVEHTKKGDRVRTLEAVSKNNAIRFEKHPEELVSYCKNELGLIDPDVRMKKILLQSLLRIDGYDVYLAGRSRNRITFANAVNLKLSLEDVSYIRLVEKAAKTGHVSKDICKEKNMLIYDTLKEKHLSSVFNRRVLPWGELLKEKRGEMAQANLSDQCKVLISLLHITSIGSSGCIETSVLGLTTRQNEMKRSNEISECNSCILINKSPAGLYENVVDLKSI